MDKRFGFIHDKLDIKILILFILARLPEKIDLDTLAELTLCDEGISYFDFAECLADLERTGHVANDDEKYTITEKGRTNGEITERNIPYSVRIKAERSVRKTATSLERASLISSKRSPLRKGGYTLTLSLSDGTEKLISLDVLTSSAEQADAAERNFRNNAERIYSDIMMLLLEE